MINTLKKRDVEEFRTINERNLKHSMKDLMEILAGSRISNSALCPISRGIKQLFFIQHPIHPDREEEK